MIIFWVFFTAILSFSLSSLVKHWSLKNKVAIQPPRERDLHKQPTPRLGGVAIVGAFLVVCTVLVAIYGDSHPVNFGFPYKTLGIAIDKRFLGILLAVVFISLVMLIDDLFCLRPIYKLLAQTTAALILVLTGIGLVYINNPFGNTIYLDSIKIPIQIGANIFHFVFWADIFLIAWVILLTNATNFIDGLDGLAATLGLVAFITLGVLSYQIGQQSTALLSAITAGAIIGFLPFNLPPAKMFLGDVGSMFVGLMLAAISVISGGKLAALLMVFALVILDAVYVIVKRILRGKNPLTTPDQTHLHHRFLHLGVPPGLTLLIIVALSSAFGVSALILTGKVKILALAVLTLISLLIFIASDLALKRRRARGR